ncbi:MAG: cofC 2 [Marmoricola sp.]|nr:cofC 2 [Marmoricola sp.]
MRAPVVLVVAKAPVAGSAKTRLGRVVGMERAADLAAAALLDTLRACESAYGVERCHLALQGDLAQARRGDDLLAATAGWTVHPQRGDGLAERLRHAHDDVHRATGSPVVQVGMDTPQLDPAHLREAGELLTDDDAAVLGPADDGGWWLLGVAGPHLLTHLEEVPMSTPDTGAHTRAALDRAGARTVQVQSLRDVDEVDDAEAVAAAAPTTEFAQGWR